MCGRISASANARALSRIRRFSSVRANSTVIGRHCRDLGSYTPPMNTPVDTSAPDSAPADLQALSAPHLSPILGRYFQRSWDRGEGHELIDTAGRHYLD